MVRVQQSESQPADLELLHPPDTGGTKATVYFLRRVRWSDNEKGYWPLRSSRLSIFLSILVSGRFSMILPRDMGSARSLGEDLGGGVLDNEDKPVSCGGRSPEFEDVEDPGE
jgi:hypothetical protein